ncbi:MAG: NB-ARC domain-containing protein [Verrucomicrobiota bacterium]|nr:NB-ARC domain-containing protein [Verrucomicrobiota bacterium]
MKADYVQRPQLESRLHQLLLNERRPIVTLVGRGGIGKTFLALQVVSAVSKHTRYDVIVWFSARDVDLQFSGPKAVRPHVLSPNDIGKYYATLVLASQASKAKMFNARAFFEEQLRRNEIGACLYVFDNFETSQNPVELFNWVDTYIRHPNKVLITTRLRDFKGDYPVEVEGMTEDEARTLISHTASELKIASLVTADYIDRLIAESEGHPYVIKILLGEVAKEGRVGNIPRLVGNRDEILTALFERTYAALTPCSQRAFLTLAAWISPIPRVALEAVLQRSTCERTEVEEGIDSLLRFSMAQSELASENQEFIRLPLVASIFGKKKLNVSPFKAAIQTDVEILQMLGPTRHEDLHFGFLRRVEICCPTLRGGLNEETHLTTLLPSWK